MNENYKILDMINSPADLKGLTKNEILSLSAELRNFIIESVSQTGGHLAAGLGTVDITIALHYVYDAPRDILVWDIGHQCYPHKILTGRKNLMPSLRKKDGMSGFLKRDESKYDAFGAGHSSTSISAAVGYEIASRLSKQDNKIIAIIGDGGLTAGMAFEALGHAGGIKSNILVILNDNEMSISPNVGAIHKYLTKILTGETFSSFKESSKKVLSKVKTIENIAKKVENQAKGLITPGLLFEELGFKYYGPTDGHDVNGLIDVLENLKDKSGPRILHVITKKGKGYKSHTGSMNAVHCVLYSGLSGGSCGSQNPLLNNDDAISKFENAYPEFFKKSGEYEKYVRTGAVESAIPSAIGDKSWKVYEVVVNRKQLEKNLTEKQIKKRLNNGF